MTGKVKTAASIVISLDFSGNTHLETIFMGRHDATYGQMDDSRLLQRELPFVLAELRRQIELGRPLTLAESELVKKQVQGLSRCLPTLQLQPATECAAQRIAHV